MDALSRNHDFVEEFMLMADLGCDTCLWARGHVSTDEYDHLLSDSLTGRLRNWYATYERDCYLRGDTWVNDEVESAWVANGNALVDALNQELGPHGYAVFAGFDRRPWSAEVVQRVRQFLDE